ncbi:MAG: F0F1 ATP synthase subunit gamma [Cyanobacteria bacterium P01_E01_bin.34]
MSNLKAIRDRIKSVQNTRKITEAMRLVAAAKVRRAQDRVVASRPFADRIVQVVYRLQTRMSLSREANLPWLYNAEWTVEAVGLIVITSNRGLCGSYNANVLKKAEERAAQLAAEGIAVKYYLVGQKAIQYYKRKPVTVEAQFDSFEQIPTGDDAAVLNDTISLGFRVGAIQRVEMVYTRFVSLISSRPIVQTLFPIDLTRLTTNDDDVFRIIVNQGQFTVERSPAPSSATLPPPQDMLFEQAPEDILEALLPIYGQTQALRALQESAASELASRMTAMNNASDNAQELIGSLKLTYNKARQSSITQELLEVVAGADAAL